VLIEQSQKLSAQQATKCNNESRQATNL